MDGLLIKCQIIDNQSAALPAEGARSTMHFIHIIMGATSRCKAAFLLHGAIGKIIVLRMRRSLYRKKSKYSGGYMESDKLQWIYDVSETYTLIDLDLRVDLTCAHWTFCVCVYGRWGLEAMKREVMQVLASVWIICIHLWLLSYRLYVTVLLVTIYFSWYFTHYQFDKYWFNYGLSWQKFMSD